MRSITKDLELTVDGKAVRFRLTKLDAFSGVKLLRLIMRLEEEAERRVERRVESRAHRGPSASRTAHEMDRFCSSTSVERAEPSPCSTPGKTVPSFHSPTIMDLLASLSEEELQGVMTSVMNHTEVYLPAGLHPVMMGSSWGWPELEHDTPTCMRLLMEGLAWSLSDFFGAGGSKPEQPAE